MTSIVDLHYRLIVGIERVRPPAVQAYLRHLDRIELRWVEKQNRLTRHRTLRACAAFVSRVGNGWAYPFLAAGLLVFGRSTGFWVMVAAVLSVLIAHAIYPLVKLFIARPRPFVTHCTLEVVGSPLDLYSFPSGHCMTASAVSVALGTAFPLSIPFAALILVLLGWARVACAHHYPSDLLCGTVIGVTVAAPIAFILLV